MKFPAITLIVHRPDLITGLQRFSAGGRPRQAARKSALQIGTATPAASETVCTSSASDDASASSPSSTCTTQRMVSATGVWGKTNYGHPLSFGLSFDTSTGELDPGPGPAPCAPGEDGGGLEYLAVYGHPYQPGHLDTWTLISRPCRCHGAHLVLDGRGRPPAPPRRWHLHRGHCLDRGLPRQGDQMVALTEKSLGIMRRSRLESSRWLPGARMCHHQERVLLRPRPDCLGWLRMSVFRRLRKLQSASAFSGPQGPGQCSTRVRSGTEPGIVRGAPRKGHTQGDCPTGHQWPTRSRPRSAGQFVLRLLINVENPFLCRRRCLLDSEVGRHEASRD